MAGALGGDHDHVDVLGRHDLAEVDVEAVGEHQRLAVLQVGRDVVLVDDGLRLVGDQHHDDVGLLGGLGGGEDLKPAFSARLPLGVPCSSATITLTPLSRRFWAWAWPWLP